VRARPCPRKRAEQLERCGRLAASQRLLEKIDRLGGSVSPVGLIPGFNQIGQGAAWQAGFQQVTGDGRCLIGIASNQCLCCPWCSLRRLLSRIELYAASWG